MTKSILQVYCPFPNQKTAEESIRDLLEKRHIACANFLSGTSLYNWEGEIEHADEIVVIMKTSLSLKTLLFKTLEKLHPYDIPCIAAKEIEVNSSYYDWLESVTSSN